MIRFVPVLLYLLVYALSASAQTRTWSGIVSDAGTGRVLESVSVCLLRADSSIVLFSRTDAAGQWRMQAEEGTGSFLSFSSLGYAKQVIPLKQCGEAMHIRLQEQSVMIREVRVKSNRIWSRGDTLNYSVSAFRQAQDRSIEDVLKKIPGIEVTDGGQIKFQNKPINKFYVEGMDLLGNKYALASKNLPAKMVRRVQVLQNHQPVAALRGKSFSDNAALNLVLEDEARHRLTGVVDLGGGVDWKGRAVWENRLMGMMFSRKMQNLTMYKNNSTGADLAAEINPLTAGMDLGGADLDEQDFFSAAPSAVQGLKRERYLRNNAHLAAVNHLLKMSGTRNLRMQLTALHDEQDAAHSEETTYYYPSQTITVSEAEDYHAQENRLDAELNYERNDTTAFVKNNLSGTLSLHKSRLSLYTNGTPLEQRIHPQRRHVQDNFSLVRNNGNQTFSLQSTNAYADLPQRLTVSPGPYADLLTGGRDYGQLTQAARLRAFSSHTSTYFQHRVAGFYLKYRAGVAYENRLLTSSLAADGRPLSAPDYANRLRLQTVEAYVEPSLTMKTAFWDLSFRLPLTYQYALLGSHLPQARTERAHKLMPTPSLRVKHDLSALWEVSASSTLSFGQPDIHSLYAGYLFDSYRSAQAYDPQLTYDKNWHSQLSLRFNQPLRGLFFTVTGMYTLSRRELLYHYENRETYLNVARAVRSPHNGRMWGGVARVSRAFDWCRLYVALAASYHHTDGKLMLEDAIADSRLGSSSISLQITMEPARFLNFEARSRASQTRSQLLYEGALPASTAWSFEHSLDINLIFSEAWRMQLANQVAHDNRTRQPSWFADASLTYTRGRWMLQLIGHNLLNRTRLSAIYLSDRLRQTGVSDLRPREVLAKVNFSF